MRRGIRPQRTFCWVHFNESFFVLYCAEVKAFCDTVPRFFTSKFFCESPLRRLHGGELYQIRNNASGMRTCLCAVNPRLS